MARFKSVTVRPTTIWREGIEEEALLVASGELEEDFAVTAKLFPPELLLRMDEILEAFEVEVADLHDSSDGAILASAERVVLALNALNDDYENDAIATGERDLLCDYIDEVITGAGIDLSALCTRNDMRRDEFTDAWRTW